MKSNQDKIEGRFDKVLSYFWDGVPVPLLFDAGKCRSQTFICRQLAFTPDYHGKTVSLSLAEPAQTTLFAPLSSLKIGPQPASCRIGSHYSQFVGLFRFAGEKKSAKPVAANEKLSVRVPVEHCEDAEEGDSEWFSARCRVRTGKIVALYKPLIKEHSPLSRRTLRNIIVLSSRGCTSVSREVIAREISDVNEEYANAESEAIFYYMCRSPLYRQILAPLQLATVPAAPARSDLIARLINRKASRLQFNAARSQLKKQLFWSPSTRGYFDALHRLWHEKFDRLSFLNMDQISGTVEISQFLGHISASVNSVVARVRIEFYANVEEFFFAHIPNANEALLISEQGFNESTFRRIFLATETFLTSKLRSMIFDGLDSLVSYFDCAASVAAVKLSKSAHLLSFLRVDLVAGELFQPRAPALALLLFGISDFFVDMERCVNSLPGVACAVLRTLRLEDRKISVVSQVEVASYRASIATVLNDTALVVDKILSAYNSYCSIPAHSLTTVQSSSDVEVAEQIKLARLQRTGIYHTSCQEMYCGRFEINCVALQDVLANRWKDYISTLAATYQQTIVAIVEKAKTRSSIILQVFETMPSNVEELEAYLQNTEAAKSLAQELRILDGNNILVRVACMESLFIPVAPDVCGAIFEFTKLPDKLTSAASKAGDMRTRCAPLLRRKLAQLRTSTSEYIQTLSTGVTELYHLFNLETCDIAAQTCAELRELVDRIEENLKSIKHEEGVLGLSAGDAFDSFPSLLHYFEVIEQYWTAIFDATKLRNMYNSPISSVNAVVSVEHVREWRRLIHSATRHLRGFPQLLQLGREQEVALSKYEELGLFLEVISSPNLRKNHWKDIAKLIAGQLREDVSSVMDLSITVKRLLDAGLMEHMAPLGQIANQAHCDYEVESALEEMRSYGKRTHFLFEDSEANGSAKTVVSQQFIRTAAEHVEHFLIRCRAMRRYPNLGLLVQKPLLEWELSCEKSCEMLAAFASIQERCSWLEDCLRTLQIAAQSKGGARGDVRQTLLPHFSACSEAIKRLHTTLRKPQFSLYTAMVQDTVQDVFLLVKGTTDEVLEMLSKSLDQRRSAVPRFHFLADAQLVQFQSVLQPQNFVPLLSWLYPHLANVETADGAVTGVVAVDGATLPLVSPLPMSTAFPDAWIAQLDSAVRLSVLAAVKNAVSAYYRADLETWLSMWPGQVVILALRVLHTEAIRHVVEIGGVDALYAYARKLSDVCHTLSQLARETYEKRVSGFTGGAALEAATKAALAYERFALVEIRSAISSDVKSVADLDNSRVLQTFISASGDELRVSCMGIDAEYGLEFLGHAGVPFTDDARTRQAVMLLANMELCRSVPLTHDMGEADTSDDIFRVIAQVLGRYFLRVELTAHTSADTLVPLLQGAIETGAFLCLANCDTLSDDMLTTLVLPMVEAYRDPAASKRWELPFGANGAAVGIPVHRLFRLALSSRAPSAVARRLSTLCEVVHVVPPDLAELMHHVLVQAGVISVAPLSVEELELAELYAQLREQLPAVFTVPHFHVILRDMIGRGDGAPEDQSSLVSLPSSISLLQRFLRSLSHTCSGVFEEADGEALYESVTTQIRARLLLPSCGGAVPREWLRFATHHRPEVMGEKVLQRFTTLMELHRRVLIVGPRFSGKSRLWRSWMGETPPLVLCPKMMSAADFYGSGSRPGFVALLAADSTQPTSAKIGRVVVLEGVDAPSSFQLFTQSWFDGTRLPEGAVKGTCVVPSKKLRVVGTATEVHGIHPGVLDGFAMLAVNGPSSWRGAIKWGLTSVPEGESARKVLEVLLPPLVERAARLSPDIVGSSNELTNMCALAQRAAALCARWYTYALSIRAHTDVLAPRDDDDEVDLRLFAARCAVMAATWSVGLSLLPEDRDAVKLTLLSAEADVMTALADGDLSGEVFPELTHNSLNPLEQVVLPQGWMSFDEAAKRTDMPLSWSNYRQLNAQLQASLQVFAMPSRLPTLRATECLVNCGQHVLLHAGAESGKTTLLHTMNTCGDWVAQVFHMNAGFNATEIQQTMASALAKRSNGRYGPPLGRRLVVCIDDLHLSLPPSGDDPVPLAGAFMNYCEQFRAINTPTLGTIPTSDVVFCASTLLDPVSRERCSTGASSGCVDVQLPAFEGEEIAEGLFQLCNMASSRKRAKGFPQECAAFLDLVHGAYCKLRERCEPFASHSPSLSLTAPLLPPNDPARPGSGELPVPGSDNRGADTSTISMEAGGSSFYTEHFRDLLEAAEVVRLHLLSTVSDLQVSARVFVGLTTFYDELLSPSTATILSRNSDADLFDATRDSGQERQVSRDFRDAVVRAAEGTLRNSVRGNVEFRDLAQELPEALSRDIVSDANETRVARFIFDFENTLKEEEETQLGVLADRQRSRQEKKTFRSGSTVRAETQHTSVLISYPDTLKVAAVRPEGLNKEVYVRRASAAVAASVRSSRRPSTASTILSNTSSAGPHQPPIPMTTATYQTTWLTTRFIHLEDSLSVPGSHILLLGRNVFGLRRLFRLWCAATHAPFMWFRVNDADSLVAMCERFFEELKATITYICRNSVHAVLYVPPPLLRAAEVLRVVDALVRSGDASSLFTDEERYTLLHGCAVAKSRSLRPFVFSNDSELRLRLRGSINFIFHLDDVAEARELGEGYPFLSQPSTTALPLYTAELEKLQLEEIALGILHSGDLERSGIRRMADEDSSAEVAEAADASSSSQQQQQRQHSATGDDGNDGSPVADAELSRHLSTRAACNALCAAFQHVCKTCSTSVEQFMEFVRLYKEFDDTARAQLVESARTGREIAGRGDAAVKAVNATKQRNRAIVEELTSTQLKLALVSEKLSGEEKQLAARAAEAEQLRAKVDNESDALLQRREAIDVALVEAKEAVAKSLKQVRKAKSGTVRAMSMSRLPDKGLLLCRALYAVLGEEVPKHNDNANELWSLSMKRMCTKEFGAELATLLPEAGTTRLSAVLPFRNELDSVRYPPALPYAQLLADFVVSYVNCVRFLAEKYPAELAEIARAKERLRMSEEAFEQKQEEVVVAGKAVTQTRKEVGSLQRTIAALQKEQESLAGSEGRLLKYTGLVDRFTRFLVGPAGGEERLKHARCAVGDTLLVAAYYALLAIREDAQDVYVSLQRVLKETVKSVPLSFSPPEEAFAQLLYQTHGPRTATLTAVDCEVPWEYKALLLSLYQRRASRWTLVGGADPIITQGLQRFLFFCCTGSVTVSACDPLAKERLVAAMRSGEGVLLRDVHNTAYVDLVRSLNPVYEKLKDHFVQSRRKRAPPKETGASPSQQSAAKAALAAQQQREEASRPIMSVWFDGQEVRVHPQFFLVCTCYPAVSSALPEPRESLNVVNFHTPLSLDAREDWLLGSVVRESSVSTKIASMQDEVVVRQQAYFEVLQEFMSAHDSAAALLAVDLRDISGSKRGDALLSETERVLALVDVLDGQMAQTTSYVLSLQRTVQDGWDTILPAVKAVARMAEQIEMARLRRPWCASGLDSCIAGIARLSPALLRRIAPLSFGDLPIAQKCYYALVHYLQRVVEMLAPGWPVPLKGFFSLSILCCAMAAAPATFAAESKVRMPSSEQLRVLVAVVYDRAAKEHGDADGASDTCSPSTSLSNTAGLSAADEQRKQALHRLYAASGDALLRRLACVSEDAAVEEMEEVFDAGGETTYYASQLFASLLELDVEQANEYAAALYDAFMASVTGLQKGPVRAVPKRATRGSLTDADRAKRSSLYGASTTKVEAGGAAVRGRAASESSEGGGGGGGAPVQVVTVDEHIQRAVKARLPLCFVAADHINDALLWLQSEVRETKWRFEWREVIPPPTLALPGSAIGGASSSAQWRASLIQRFRELAEQVVKLVGAACAPETCGVCLTLIVDMAAPALSSGDGAAAAAEDVAFMREEWQRLLSLYTAVSARGGSGASMLCLAIVCSTAAQQHLWGELPDASLRADENDQRRNRIAQTVPCCYISLSTNTPQLALLELLRPTRRAFTKDGALQVCDAILLEVQSELNSRVAQEAAPDKRATRVRGPALAKLNAAHGGVASAFPLPVLPTDLATTTLIALQNAVRELRSCARLLQCEITVAYIASTSRLRILDASQACLEESSSLDATPSEPEQKMLRCHLYDPAPLLRLHRFLAAWVRQRYEDLVVQLGGVPSTATPQAESSLLPGLLTSGIKTSALPPQLRVPASLPVPIQVSNHHDAAEDSISFGYGMQAYYYLRRNQPAWELLMRKAERIVAEAAASAGNAAAVVELFNPALCAVMRADDAHSRDGAATGTRPLRGDAAETADSWSVARRPHQRKHHDQIVEETTMQMKSGLFVLARKFALYFFCSREVPQPQHRHTAPSVVSSMEGWAQWTMLRSLLGAAGDTDEVACLWGPLAEAGQVDEKGWQDLRIDARHVDTFRSDVAAAASDLLELCGEESMLLGLREMLHRDVSQLCFPLTLPPSRKADPASRVALGYPSSSTDATAEETKNLKREVLAALTALQDAEELRAGAPGTMITPVEALLRWESPSLDACLSRPAALTDNFLHMVRSFAATIAHQRDHARTPGTAPAAPPVHVWLPSLRHPLYDLRFLSSMQFHAVPHVLARYGALPSPRVQSFTRSRGDPFADTLSGDGAVSDFLRAKWCGDVGSALVVVVTRQRLLSAADVVLRGATLSASLRRRVAEAMPELDCSAGDGAAHTTIVHGGKEKGKEVEEPLIVVRRVLVRHKKATKGKTPRPSAVPDGEQVGSSSPHAAVEVGMYVRRAESAAAGSVIWCSAVQPPLTTEGILWDTRATCRPGLAASPAPSFSTAHSGSVTSTTYNASGNFFVTEVRSEDDGAPEPAVLDNSVRLTWAFSDVPIPLQWRSAASDGKQLQKMELFLCVEGEKLCHGNQHTDAADAAGERGGEKSASSCDEVVGEILQMKDMLDTYIHIV